MPRLTFLGHSAFLLEEGDTRMAIDPFLTGNPQAPKRPEEIVVQWVIATHGHGDHLGDALDIAKRNNATIIAPFELATYCQNKGANVHPMHIGGSYTFPFGRVKLTIAHHGSAVVEGDQIIYTGNPCGVLVTLGGKTLYHPGDTGLFYDMKLIGEMNRIDVAVLPIGGNFTMDIDDAVRATEFLNPGLVIPMHYGTFDVIQADPQEFARKVKAKGFQVKVLAPGEATDF